MRHDAVDARETRRWRARARDPGRAIRLIATDHIQCPGHYGGGARGRAGASHTDDVRRPCADVDDVGFRR